jgi:probable HAF family extracellular repeat protein
MRNHGKVLSLLMSACFIAANATIAFAQDAGTTTGKCSFQKLNLPAQLANLRTEIDLVALNDVGGILGTYEADDSHFHGFLLYRGKFTTFMFPGSTDTIPSDMNTTGTIVGTYFGKGVQQAFMVHSGGFHEIKIPGFPNVISVATGVNDHGDVVGVFQTNNTNRGFLLHNGKLTILSFPGAGDTQPVSINNQGVIVGVYDINFPTDPFRGFMWKDGVFSNLNPPESGGHSQPEKISNAGDVVGTYISTIDGAQHGFSFDQGRYTTIDVPGLQSTAITAVNKFDNVLAQAIQGTTILFKGFCSAVF